MTDQLNIEHGTTAILIMDYQYRQLLGQQEARRDALLANAGSVLASARSKGIPVIYVEVRSRKGPPDFRPWDHYRRQKSGREDLGKREKEFEIHPAVVPQKGEVVVTKRRVGPFSTTDLSSVLERLRIETMVLLGISTGGCVLSTVRWAADIDYQLIILADCCADPDEEVHRVLVEKVFPRQATVVTSPEFLEALG